MNFNPAFNVSENPKVSFVAENGKVSVKVRNANGTESDPTDKPSAEYGDAAKSYADQPYNANFKNLKLTLVYTVE